MFAHVDLRGRRETPPLLLVGQAHVRFVVTGLQPDCTLREQAAQAPNPRIAYPPAVQIPLVVLVDAVSTDRVILKEGEIVEEVEL